MNKQYQIFKLKGKVQHYAWGGFHFIPSWLGIENAAQQPFAEYWMGAHSSAPSYINYNNEEQSLDKLIEKHPEHLLSQKTYQQFGTLPYLFKILDVHDMLSIQVHPSKTEAEKGFAHEQEKGIHISALHRNYKDKNHKPEMMVALSEFWLLHGFKQKEQIKQTLSHIKEFEGLIPIFNDGDYKALYSHVMLMPQHQTDAMLLPLIQKEIHLKEKKQLHKSDPGWWVSKLFDQKEVKDNFDKGIFSIYFFNIVNLHSGQAIFQDAGLPHAYLEGQNIELMASSDNVLRGGLTNKHIDVPELIKHTLFEGIAPVVINGSDKSHIEKNYASSTVDFGLSSITLKKGEVYESSSSSLEILCIMDGELQITGTNHLQALRGEAIAILPAEKYKIETPSFATIYKAFVP